LTSGATSVAQSVDSLWPGLVLTKFTSALTLLSGFSPMRTVNHEASTKKVPSNANAIVTLRRKLEIGASTLV
jgi:hypothetical protein